METVQVLGPSAITRYGRRTPDVGDPSPPGPGWDLVTVPARRGLEAVDILRLRTAVGPVLHDRSGDTLGFLVPPGTAAVWDLPGSVCCGTPACPRVARPGPVEPPVPGTGWLVPPGLAAPVTDPALLREALGEAARTIEAAAR